MEKLIFATNNPHKLNEIRHILEGKVEIVGLDEIGCREDIPETADTLQGNALLKAEFVHKRYGLPCFADDTGLEVEALDGAPGVHSARYAGEPTNADANVRKLLEALSSVPHPRKACFRTVIALIDDHGKHFFEGKIEGTIASERRGSGGFGYDPVFIPEEHTLSFAEMGEETKNQISHRALAVAQLRDFLLCAK